MTNKIVLYSILGGGVNISWGGSKYRYDILTPGSKYRTIYWPRGQYIGESKYRLTPVRRYFDPHDILTRGQNIVTGGGVNISWGGSKYRYDILTPGSKYRTIYWPRGQYIGESKYRLTPARHSKNLLQKIHLQIWCAWYLWWKGHHHPSTLWEI